MDEDRLVDLVRHAPALEALREEGSMDRREFEQHLGVSKSTVYRITRSLREDGLIERSSGEFVLTALGEISAEEVIAFGETMEAAWRLTPVLEIASAHGVELSVAAFVDATVTTAAPGNPYRPVNRFMELVSETETLRGLDPASINPLHFDEINTRIVEGMRTDAIFPTTVIEELITSNPERAKRTFESGNLTLRVHDDLPFGLTLCDERIGIGTYDEETGLLQTYIDTDASEALEWAEEVYAEYRREATEVQEHDEIGRLPLVREEIDDDC